jgi:hypothetical protein
MKMLMANIIMKMSEAKEGEFIQMDKLQMVKLPSGEFHLALPGSKLKQGEMPFDVTVTVSTRERFIDAVNKADHDNDWYSLLLKEAMIKIWSK